MVNGRSKDLMEKDFSRMNGPPIFLSPQSLYEMESWILVVGPDTQAYLGHGMESTEGGDLKILTSTPVSATDGWKKVRLQIKTEKKALPLDPRLLVIGPGKAFFDDFRFIRCQTIKPESSSGSAQSGE
jgi:hypothetical protein